MGREPDYMQILDKTRRIVTMILHGPPSWTIPVTNYFPGRGPVRSPYGVFDLAEDIGMWCGTVAKDIHKAGLISDHVRACLEEMGDIAEGQEDNPEFDSLDAFYTHPLWKRIRELAREVADELGMDVE